MQRHRIYTGDDIMAAVDNFEFAFRRFKRKYKAKTRRAFLDDLYGQIEEDADLIEIFTRKRRSTERVVVTFDRKFKNVTFSYDYFDMTLRFLDAISGGSGIYKPVNQIRALRWLGTREELKKVPVTLGASNPRIRVNRTLILPYPDPVVGVRIDTSIHSA
jgi:hypothetical protein